MTTPSTTHIVTAYRAPGFGKNALVAAVSHLGTTYTVRRSEKAVTTVWLDNVRITKTAHARTFHAVVGVAYGEWEAMGLLPGSTPAPVEETATPAEQRVAEQLAAVPAAVEETVEDWGGAAPVVVRREYDAPAAPDTARRTERELDDLLDAAALPVRQAGIVQLYADGRRTEDEAMDALGDLPLRQAAPILRLARSMRPGAEPTPAEDTDAAPEVPAVEPASALRVAGLGAWTPDEVLPSGRYGVKRATGYPYTGEGVPVVRVVQQVRGSEWGPTPGQWSAGAVADGGAVLSLDAGAGWVLSEGDTTAVRRFARGLLAR